MAFTYAGLYVETTFDGVVALLPGRSVAVKLVGTLTNASLYTTRLKATAATNPVVIDSKGNLSFYADPGLYDLRLVTNGVEGAPVTVTVPVDSAEPAALATAGDVTEASARAAADTTLQTNINTNTTAIAGKATDTLVAHLAGAETVTGVKTFTANPVLNAGALPESAVASLVADLAAKATDSLVVHLAGTETITGAKDFTGGLTKSGAVVATATDTALLLAKASNLSDVASAASARTNLGLGTAAVVADASLAHLAGAETFSGAKTFAALVQTAASATGGAGVRVPHGVAPTAPVDGDMWTTTAGLFIRINGVTKSVNLT